MKIKVFSFLDELDYSGNLCNFLSITNFLNFNFLFSLKPSLRDIDSDIYYGSCYSPSLEVLDKALVF